MNHNRIHIIIDGSPHSFKSKKEAMEYIKSNKTSLEKSFDVIAEQIIAGCGTCYDGQTSLF